MASNSIVETGMANTRDQNTFHYLLSTLLSQASYAPELQQQYLSFFTTRILPYLGNFPNWTPNLTHNGSPFEPSLNIRNGQSLLRFCIEPVSSISGTSADPFSQALSFTLVEEFARLDVFEGFDTELWEFFTKELYIWDAEEVEKVMRIKEVRTLRSCLLAFDLKKNKPAIMLKAYVNVFRKAHILERSPAEVLFEAIRKLPGREDEKASLDKLEEFLKVRDGGYKGIQNMAKGNIVEVQGLNVVMISFDFIDPLKARMKIYARSYELTFSNFKDIYTLGGQICICNEELDVFKSFYKAIFDLPESWDGVGNDVERLNIRHGGVLWQFELVHGKQIPEIKLYISFWNFVPNDADAARRLKRFFNSQSWEIADSYSEKVEKLFNGMGNIEEEAGRHSYVSFSYSKERGPYLTLYYAPKLEQEQ